MKIIGLTQQEQDNIFRMLALILWIGNISFVEDENGNAAIRDDSVTNFAAYLLDVNPEILKKLSLKTIETSHGMRRGSTYHSPLNIVQPLLYVMHLPRGFIIIFSNGLLKELTFH